MLAVIALSALISCCAATPLSAVWLSPIAPVAPLGQYQTDDGSGSYHYAYLGPHHSKVETRLGGTIQRGYSYVDANGILQTIAYTAGGPNGFHPQQFRPVKVAEEVAASNIGGFEKEASNVANTWPMIHRVGSDTDNKLEGEKLQEGVEKPIENPLLIQKMKADQISKDVPELSGDLDPPTLASLNNVVEKDIRKPDPSQGQIHGFSQFGAVPHYVLPVVPYRRMHSSLRHTQDSLGQYDYSYAGDTSAKTESRSLDGTTRGAYSYIDANGLLQQVHYIADQNGFRVAATNLPEAK